jgi:hypothetical protein
VLRDVFEARYRELVAAWVRHHDLRRGPAPLPELAASRRRLDLLRDAVNTTRRAFAPDRAEIESVLLTAYCDRYGETVFLYAADAAWGPAGPRFRCVCGDPIDGEGDRIAV